MQILFKERLTGFGLLMLMVSLACNAPFGAGLPGAQDGSGQPAEIVELQFPTATPTPIPTSTNTATPTNTPEPTETPTLVVPLTSTPTPVSGASGAAAVSVSGGGPIAVASSDDVVVNGSFEDSNWPASQGIAPGWTTFDNSSGHFSWYDDTWTKVVFDGEHAQMIEIIANAGQDHRYAGIYQTLDVVAGAEYELTIHGLVRSDEGSGDASGFGYVLQYGLDQAGGDNWTLVTEWVDLPFPEHPREDPDASNVYDYGTYTTKIIPTGRKLTLYIRAWKKWSDFNEGNYDVDAISLRGTGAQPVSAAAVQEGAATPIPQMPETGDRAAPPKLPATVLFLSLLSVLILFGGAIIGLTKRRPEPAAEAIHQEKTDLNDEGHA